MYFQLLYPHMFCPAQSPLVNTTPPGPIRYDCAPDKFGEWDGTRAKPAYVVEFIPVAYELDALVSVPIQFCFPVAVDFV